MTPENSGQPRTRFLPNEAELVVSALSDEGAFTALYDFYFPRIYSFVCRRIGHRQETEDIVSEVFMKAVAALPKLAKSSGSGGVKFGGWLYRVAVTTVIDRHRRRKSRPMAALEEADLIPDGAPGPEEAVQRKQETEKLCQLVSRLPRRDQEILHLKFYAEMGNDEIAAALGISPNAAGVQIHRALRKAAKIREQYV